MKKNPFEVLGVPESANDEQVREAYRTLARKYQSDNYSGGNLAGVAAAKMKELDEAYDAIIMLRSTGGGSARSEDSSSAGSGGWFSRSRKSRNNVDYDDQNAGGTGGYSAGPQYSSYGGQSYSAYGNGDFDDIRAKIRSGRLDDAEMLLDGISEGMRSAEWYFLKGSIQNRRGWLEEASANFARACRMEPNNNEFRAAYNNLNHSGSGGYRTENTRKSDCSACDVCSGLICADCCCECMGGDLIRCC